MFTCLYINAFDRCRLTYHARQFLYWYLCRFFSRGMPNIAGAISCMFPEVANDFSLNSSLPIDLGYHHIRISLSSNLMDFIRWTSWLQIFDCGNDFPYFFPFCKPFRSSKIAMEQVHYMCIPTGNYAAMHDFQLSWDTPGPNDNNRSMTFCSGLGGIPLMEGATRIPGESRCRTAGKTLGRRSQPYRYSEEDPKKGAETSTGADRCFGCKMDKRIDVLSGKGLMNNSGQPEIKVPFLEHRHVVFFFWGGGFPAWKSEDVSTFLSEI